VFIALLQGLFEFSHWLVIAYRCGQTNKQKIHIQKCFWKKISSYYPTTCGWASQQYTTCGFHYWVSFSLSALHINEERSMVYSQMPINTFYPLSLWYWRENKLSYWCNAIKGDQGWVVSTPIIQSIECCATYLALCCWYYFLRAWCPAIYTVKGWWPACRTLPILICSASLTSSSKMLLHVVKKFKVITWTVTKTLFKFNNATKDHKAKNFLLIQPPVF